MASLLQYATQALENLVNGANPVHLAQYAFVAIKIDHRRCLLLVYLKPVSYDIGGIIAAAFLAGAVGYSLSDLFVVDIYLDRFIKRNIQPRQHFIQCFGLQEVPGVTIEDETGLCIVKNKPFLEQAKHQVVRDKVTRIHKYFYLQTQRGFSFYRGSQELARRNVGDAQGDFQEFCLGAFSRPGGAQQYNSHGVALSIKIGR